MQIATFVYFPTPFADQDVWATIDEQIHGRSPEIGEILRDLVKDKTPVRTGALKSDISYEAYLDPGGAGGESDIVWIYAEEVQQLAYWNRVYVTFQEGPPLYIPIGTPTNRPQEMFYLTATTDGLDTVDAWAQLVIADSVAMCVVGAGIPI